MYQADAESLCLDLLHIGHAFCMVGQKPAIDEAQNFCYTGENKMMPARDPHKKSILLPGRAGVRLYRRDGADGRLICVVGVAPVRPGKFVILNTTHIMEQNE